MIALPARLFLVVVFPFYHFGLYCATLSSCRISAEKSTDNFMGVSLDITCCFLFATLIFSYLFIYLFAILFTVCLGMVLFRLILFGTLCILDLGVCSFSYLGKVSAIMSSTMFSVPLSLLLLGPL